MMSWVIKCIRYMGELFVIVKVYEETGIWTVFALALITISIETDQLVWEAQEKLNDAHGDLAEKVVKALKKGE